MRRVEREAVRFSPAANRSVTNRAEEGGRLGTEAPWEAQQVYWTLPRRLPQKQEVGGGGEMGLNLGGIG